MSNCSFNSCRAEGGTSGQAFDTGIANTEGSGGGGVLTAGGVVNGGSGLNPSGVVVSVGGVGGGGGRGISSGGPGGDGGFGSGGGGALGGAIFIDQSATLTIEKGISFTGSSLIPGVGDAPGLGYGRDIFMRSTSNLVVTGLTSNSTVPNPIESNRGSEGEDVNSGGLTLDTGNTARFTLNGDNTYTGSTVVNTGILYVNGSVITPVTVHDGGFGGTNTVIKIFAGIPTSGNLTMNCGTLFPGGDGLYGNLTVERNLELSSICHVLNAEVDSVGNTDFIQVNGTAQINDAILDVEGIAGSFLEGQVIPILDANGGVTGTFGALTQPPRPEGELIFALQYLPNRVQLVVLENVVFEEPGQTNLKRNPAKVCDYIMSQLPIDPTSDLGFIVNSIGLLTGKDFTDALHLLHPGVFGALEWMNLTTSVQATSLFQSRLFLRNRTANSPPLTSYRDSLTASTDDRPFYPNASIRKGCARDFASPHSVWVQPFGSWNTQS